jgi:hypothetical protein
MKGGGGFLLVFVGIVVLWMAITGRLECLSAFVSCMSSGSASAGGTADAGSISSMLGKLGSFPALPIVPTFPNSKAQTSGTTIVGATPGYHP